MSLWHWIQHRFGWNCGTVETWWDGPRLMVGFRCTCGRMSGVHESYTTQRKSAGGTDTP